MSQHQSALMAAAVQNGYINTVPSLSSAGGAQLTTLQPPNGITLPGLTPTSGENEYTLEYTRTLKIGVKTNYVLMSFNGNTNSVYLFNFLLGQFFCGGMLGGNIEYDVIWNVSIRIRSLFSFYSI